LRRQPLREKEESWMIERCAEREISKADNPPSKLAYFELVLSGDEMK
jgi:hypothetical protein